MPASWWKSYAIYLVTVAPFVALTMWLVHARWLIGVAAGVIVFVGLTVKDRIQRRIWP
jgi:hypothetical protein